MKNGKQIGDAHIATLEQYFSAGGALPVSTKDGTLNLTALASATGIPKSSFYQNPRIKQRVEIARIDAGLARQGERLQSSESNPGGAPAIVETKGDGSTALLERRLHRLEQQNAALVAENYELRRQVKEARLQLGREDMMIETGVRIVPPLGAS